MNHKHGVILTIVAILSISFIYVLPRKQRRSSMLFKDVAHYLNEIEATSSRLAMTQQLAMMFKEASPIEANIICNISLGQLNPPYIGTQFNIAEKNMVKVIAELLGKNETAIASEAKKLGDLGSIVQGYTWRTSTDLTITEVYKKLHAIEEISGTGSQEEKAIKIRELLENLDTLSAKYVIRIIIGKLRLGFSDMTIIDALSWMEAGDKSLRAMIENAYNVCADIGLIAQTLKKDGIEAIKKMHIHVGIPILPAAAERLPTARDIFEKLGPCIAQPKLDGFRLQIHVDKTGKTPKIHFFSRNLQDMSYMFPDLQASIEKLDVKELICEGEAIVFDADTGTFLPFQETVKRKRKHDIESVMEELPLRVFLFDLLYYDGHSYLRKTHDERRKALEKIFKNFGDETLQIIEEQRIHSAHQLQDYFTHAIAAGLEGLVVKKPDSIYQPGKRNFNWIKLKRTQEGELEDTIDCVVLGYNSGSGKRASFGIGAFLAGVYNKKEDRFETIAKIGTGLKDQDWIDIKKKCDSLKVKEQPKNVVCAKELAPDVWCSPELVVTIFADEITLSPVHSAGKTIDHLGFALRFPRFIGYRPDKSAVEITTIGEIKHMYEDQFKK